MLPSFRAVPAWWGKWRLVISIGGELVQWPHMCNLLSCSQITGHLRKWYIVSSWFVVLAHPCLCGSGLVDCLSVWLRYCCGVYMCGSRLHATCTGTVAAVCNWQTRHRPQSPLIHRWPGRGVYKLASPWYLLLELSSFVLFLSFFFFPSFVPLALAQVTSLRWATYFAHKLWRKWQLYLVIYQRQSSLSLVFTVSYAPLITVSTHSAQPPQPQHVSPVLLSSVPTSAYPTGIILSSVLQPIPARLLHRILAKEFVGT